jgi:hypothetical protein
MTFIIYFLLKINLYKAFSGISISILVIGLSEMFTLAFIQYILGLDPQAVRAKAGSTFIASIPSILILYLSAFVAFKISSRHIIGRELFSNAE